MAANQHPLAPEHLPGFLGTADGSDPLFTGVIWFLVILLMIVGNFYLKLHAMPERMAHRHNNAQLQVITVLALLALFTHNNIFWVAALLLGVIKFPDFSTPLNSIAQSLAKLTDQQAPNSEEKKITENREATDSSPTTEREE